MMEILFEENDDEFDVIGKFKYDEKSGNYILKRNKKGEAKTHIDNIEKGILKDGMNFMTNDNAIAVGGEGQPTVEGFQDFIVQFSDMIDKGKEDIDKEIGGYYMSKDGSDDVSHIYVSRYLKNTENVAISRFEPYCYAPELINIKPHTNFHTHLSKFDNLSRLTPSSQDRQFKNNQKINNLKRFIILTRGELPIEY